MHKIEFAISERLALALWISKDMYMKCDGKQARRYENLAM